jgi:hypothetical protein
MPSFVCYPADDDRQIWMYCPSYAGAIAFTTLFGLATLAHIIQMFLLKKPFAFVLVMAGIWETGGYAFRIMSVRNQATDGYFIGQQMLIILAPLWINAFVYMVLGRMIHYYLENDRVFNIRARRITVLFVLFDVVSFIIQATGGMMINDEFPVSTQKAGQNIYMAGVGVQIGFIAIFMMLAIQFQRLVKREDFQGGYSHLSNSKLTPTYMPSQKSMRQAKMLLCAVYSVLLLIIFRNTYRLIEFSRGIESDITRHEWYTWVFDSMPMLICFLIFNVFHPGFVLKGPKSDFSEENRLRKEEKKAKKKAKGIEKEEKKAAMLMQRLDKKEAKKAAKGQNTV